MRGMRPTSASHVRERLSVYGRNIDAAEQGAVMADQQPSTGRHLPAIVADKRRWNQAAPTGGLLARHRIALARFGTDVAAVGGIGPALAAGLDPADYPVVPGGVPQAWGRALVYLGLYERYHELYQAQLAELHHLMATAPAPSDKARAAGPARRPDPRVRPGRIR
jgi:hypothetical protein